MPSTITGFGVYPAPVGSLTKYFKSHIFVVDHEVLWYSREHQYESFELATDFIQFDSNIVEIFPMETGMYVALEDNQFGWMPGTTPEKFTFINGDNMGVVRNSGVIVPNQIVQMQGMPPGYRWLITGDDGIHALFEGGVIANLTGLQVEMPFFQNGAATLVRNNGMDKYIVSIRDPVGDNTIQPTDLVTADIIRNGIRI
jgi:hypothetical protein